ncbi:TetR/AcrR family transcriptional regulator C-terminal domain-containing protein [Amycolatopsis jejuensis]|uniref:TetR/AcrR family transcriptional regulator C-terminal domain-containing protein n=1 Tax=Amycolatopsis jejuensis TaxID=330084 RepID=UPI00068D1DB8|nr:TetR/AcrR family transcriptional regulator C-terminal domain-containing protein [Amycolatopsis jejuensis]
MTKRQPIKAGITLGQVVAAAFAVLDRGGLDKLSTRAIAADLGVSMNTVMWHIRTKARLLDLLAEAIFVEVDVDGLPSRWDERVAELHQRLRVAMLGHRDGARVVAGTFVNGPGTLGVTERVVDALLEGCPTRRTAVWTSWSLFYFTLGLVQEEQAAAEIDLSGTYQVPEEFPVLNSVLDEFRSVDFDNRFRFGLEQILRSAPVLEAP